ncbi:MAG: PEP-CTERM sorting domain-containing protein [Armatimonadota bacterium]|nr:PEP-CTERM sorting domain-containing protein [bacterium]
MKKVIVFGLVGMMVLGMAVAAGAATADNGWMMSIKAGIGALASSETAGAATIGVGTSISTADWPMPQQSPMVQVNVALPGGSFIGTKNRVLYTDANLRWDMYIWNPMTSSDTVDLVVYNTSMYKMNTGDSFKLWEEDAKHAGYYTLLYSLTDDARGTGTANAVAWETSLTVARTASVGTAAAPSGKHLIATANYDLQTFTEPIVPEPGSIVAMLSGLVGLAGFGIRRRK